MKARNKYLLMIVLLMIILVSLWRYSNLPRLLKPGTFTHFISDVSRLSVIHVNQIKTPRTVNELKTLVQNAKHPIALAGSRHSQGGQIACSDCLVIDMTALNAITHLDVEKKLITVQAGATWAQIQNYIDPYNLSIQVMQSYNDFTIGGSLSVNVHGRELHHGLLIATVREITVMLADGSLIKASRTEHYDLFRAAIGGYGALGIIVDATLELTDNQPIERKVALLSADEYPDFFFGTIISNTDAVFHNANIYPPEFNQVLSVTWYKTNQPVSLDERLQTEHALYLKSMCEEQLIRIIPALHTIQPIIECQRMVEKAVVWRNYEMSHRVRSLEPFVRFPTTTILQEYFIPVAQFNTFIHALTTIAREEHINIINVSIRYVPKNTESILSYAKQKSFALVMYINMHNTHAGKKIAKQWTQKLINVALDVGGTYYLPYQLYATQEQFERAYPQINELREIKKKYDPGNKFQNLFIQKYILQN